MNQIHQNIRSTQPAVLDPIPDSDMVQEDKYNYIYAAIMDTDQIYTDITGRFTTTYISGNKYILILYDYDSNSNSVLAAPRKNRGDKDMVRDFDLFVQSLIIRGLKPSLQRLYNEASLALRNYLTKQGIDYQRAPPHVHRRNNAERAIQTFKNHFIAGLCSVDPNFPLKLWYKLLPQAEITLNLLRKSRINPRMSAYAQLNDHFDFNRTPLAPPGTRIIAHDKPDQQASWGPHGVDGYYVGPVLDHCRCYQVHITKTKGTRIVDTVEFSRQKYPYHIHLQKIWPAFQLWNCPMPFKTHPLRRPLVTLAQRNFKHCANYRRFSQRPFHLELHNMHPQGRKTPQNSGALSHRALAHRKPPAYESRLYQKLQTSLNNLPSIDLRGWAPARHHLRGWHLE
jgi:hypothetical protein